MKWSEVFAAFVAEGHEVLSDGAVHIPCPACGHGDEDIGYVPLAIPKRGAPTCAGAGCSEDKIREALRLPEEAAPTRASRSAGKRKGALTGPPPGAGASGDELCAWLTTQLRLPAPIVLVRRWGTSAAAPIHLMLENGRKIRFDEAAQLNSALLLPQVVVLALGADAPTLPAFTKTDAQQVFTVAIRAAGATDADDEAERTEDWMGNVVANLSTVHGGDYGDPAARWAGLNLLKARPLFDATAQRFANNGDSDYAIPALAWADGSTYVRVGDAEQFVRGVLGQRVASQQIVGRMREAGWKHRRAEARRPGAGRDRGEGDRVQVSVFVVPGSADATQTDVSSTSLDRTPAHATPAHARSRGCGRLRTHAETPVAPENLEAEDTAEAEDTSQDVGSAAHVPLDEFLAGDAQPLTLEERFGGPDGVVTALVDAFDAVEITDPDMAAAQVPR